MNVLVVYCHPDPESFIAAARCVVVDTLKRGGHEVRVEDLYADGFQPAMTADERLTHREPGVAAELQHYADDLRWCEAIVLVYPTWWSGLPAMLKGWVDRVWARGIAWDLPAGASTVRGRLRNVRRLAIVTSHGSSRWVNWLEGQCGRFSVMRGLRVLCHPLTRTSFLAIYAMDSNGHDDRRRFLDHVERRFISW
ncbi:MAG: NAD(P)H-dependent oxidoreductase [Acidimicrobiia bacterium]|nr:NAD(P)H-dependent oxidoreductase [Acidimicrobiia bacterium]